MDKTMLYNSINISDMKCSRTAKLGDLAMPSSPFQQLGSYRHFILYIEDVSRATR